MVPGVGACCPQGHNVNKFGSDPLDDILHQISKCVTPRGIFWSQRPDLNKLIVVH